MILRTKCKICSTHSPFFARARLLAKYDIQYFQCPNCGFVQTEEPYWFDEAYSEAITKSDVGLVSRNTEMARLTRSVITVFFNGSARFLDYGGGYGLLVRLMRDHGFNFYRYDKYSANLFAQGFDADDQGQNQYELITAFEVFEHLPSPKADIAHMLGFSRNIFFSTALIPLNNPKPDEWWYYGVEHGQHVGLYTRKSLQLIAQEFGLNLYSNGVSLHLLTEKRISSLVFGAVLRHRVAGVLGSFWRGKSLVAEDYHRITGKRLV